MKVFVVHLKSDSDKPVVKTVVACCWRAAAEFIEAKYADEVLSISVVNDDVDVL